MDVKEKEVMNKNIWKFGLYNFIDHIRMIWMIKTLFLLWLGFNFTNMSIHESILALVIFLFEVPLGALADFIGKRKAIIISAGLHGVGFMLMGIMNVPVHYYFIAIIMGLAFSFFSGSDVALLYDSLKKVNREKEYKKIRGKINAIGQVGSIIGVFVGPALYLVNPRLGFLLTGAIYLLGAIVLLTMKEPYQFHHKFTLKKHWQQTIESLKFSFKHVQVRWIIFYFFVGHIIYELVFAFFQQPILTNVGVTVEFFGILFAVMMGIRAIGAYFADHIEKLLKENLTLLLVLLSQVAIFWFLASGNLFVVVPFIGLLYFIYGFEDVILEDYINAHISSNKRATVLSVQSMFHNAMMIIIFIVVGKAIDLFSMGTTLRYISITLLLFTLILFTFKRGLTVNGKFQN
ncbi:MFS transporter [Candidatus Woesearchaeota archaeon]|jgi:MFS family permease|nr:MFS transporter [Candidatus Woesearchaeota archaeon]